MNEVNKYFTDDLIVTFPWYLVEIIEGVNVDDVYRDNYAEVAVDNKFQGKYMNICRVLQSPADYSCPDDMCILAGDGDLVCVWSTAVEQFKLLSYGEVSMVRNADIFLIVRAGTDLHKKIQEAQK